MQESRTNIRPGDKFWVVLDPESTDAGHTVIEDICFQTDIIGLGRQFIGGLNQKSQPTIYFSKTEAMAAARIRLFVRK